MKKNIILFGIIIVLAGIAYYLTQNKNPENQEYDFSYRDFAVKDVNKIHKIVLINRNQAKGINTLERKGDRWTVNGKYLASKNNIANILNVISRVRIDYVPPNAAIENIMRDMIYNSVKVELYDEDDNIIKKYYVGGSPARSKGTYFVMDGSAKPLVMGMPGFKGNLKVRFAYSLDEWRDKTIFGENPENIVEVAMKYNFENNSSFIIKKEGEIYNVLPAFESQKKINKTVNQNLVSSYLLGFENKGAEAIENSNENLEDILSREPIVEIDIKRKDGTLNTTKFYMFITKDDEIQNNKQGINKYLNQNIFRYIAHNNNGDSYLVQYGVLKDLFVEYEYFMK